MKLSDLKDVFKGKQNIGESVKTIGGAVVNIGTDMVVSSLLAAGLCPKKGLKRAVGSCGIFILSMKIGEVAEEYFCELWDDLKEAFGTAKKELEEAKEEEKKTEEKE